MPFAIPFSLFYNKGTRDNNYNKSAWGYNKDTWNNRKCKPVSNMG